MSESGGRLVSLSAAAVPLLGGQASAAVWSAEQVQGSRLAIAYLSSIWRIAFLAAQGVNLKLSAAVH
jgi:hypothetical protein